MRTDNRKVKNTVISIYFILLLLGILMATVFKYLALFANSSFIIFISVFALIVVLERIKLSLLEINL